MAFDLFIADVFFLVIGIIAMFIMHALYRVHVKDNLRLIMIYFFAARAWTMMINFLFYLVEPPFFTPMYLRLLTLIPEAIVMIQLLIHLKKHR